MGDFQNIFAANPPQPGYCLLLRPFNQSSDNAWDAIGLRLEHTFRWTDIKELTGAGAIMDQILTEIARNDVVIVDITGNNPNVFFELGIARTAKPERKVLIVRRKGDADDDAATVVAAKGSVISIVPRTGDVPFDVRSDRYLPFTATAQGIEAFLPMLETCLWEALEKSQWFVIGKGDVFVIGPLESEDRRGTYRVEVQPTEFVERQFGPKAGKVRVKITITASAGRGGVADAAPQIIESSLGYDETVALGSLPWRLKFHWFEGDNARLCIEPTARPKRSRTRG